jgi:acylphosphatase
MTVADRDADKTVHFLVSGRVQGVFFRMATKQQADLYGLSGWVCNRRDGRVEGVVAGASQRLDDFIAWLHRGPDLARVLKVELEEVEGEENYSGFEIR